MTDEEKLKEYLLRNTPKKQKPVSTKSSSVPNPGATTPTRSAVAYYRRKIIGDIIAFTVVVFMASFLALLYFSGKEASVDMMKAFTWTLTIAALLLFLVISLAVFYISRYINWVNGQYYPLKGWNEFFDLRSPSFWSKRMYTNVRVSFKLKDSATNLHREATQTFIKKVVDKWNKRYSKIDWESGYGTPKDLISDGTSFYGDISRVELIIVVRMLTSEFIPLANLLGSNLEEVSIKSQAAEKEIKTKKVSRNAYDRQSGFGK